MYCVKSGWWGHGLRREKLWEHWYRERYARFLEGKGVEWDGENNVEHMQKQMKWAMVENVREIFVAQ